MKKIIALLILTVMAVTAFVGCTTQDATTTQNTTTTTEAPAAEGKLKFGLGTATTASAKDATSDKAGQAQLTITIAAVLVDEDGKVVKAFIDCADSKGTYTAAGKANAADSFKTKYELGKDYNMVAYGGAVKEWFEQVDAYCALIVGKTAAEIKALEVEDGKGTDAVISAGCTITISDMTKAVENAIANAAESSAKATDSVKIGVSTALTATDATAEKAGSSKISSTIYAAAVGADGKVSAASSDCIEVSFGFDITGKSTFDASKAIKSKKELGKDYNMVAYGGAVKEWFEQAAAFDAATLGKTVAEIKALEVDGGKGTADLQSAGCTIVISDFVKAAAKIG